MSTQQSAAEADAAVAEPDVPAVKPKRKGKSQPKKKPPRRQPRYHVILWNDDDHSFEYVIEMMQKLFNHPKEKGFLIADEVHRQGKAIVLTTTMEHAELKRDQVHAYGKDREIKGCKGSMSASIEPEC